MESFDDWTILELKDYLLQHNISMKDIKGSGKNGNVVRKDLIKVLKKIHRNDIKSSKLSFKLFKKSPKQSQQNSYIKSTYSTDIQLNDDILYEIMLNASIDVMKPLCLSSHSLYNICQDNDFWQKKLTYHSLPPLYKSPTTMDEWIKEYTKLFLYQHHIIKFINRMLELNVFYIICEGVVKNMIWYDFDITNKNALKITFFIEDNYIGFLSTYEDVESSTLMIQRTHQQLINDFTLLLYYSPDVKFGRGLTCYDKNDKKILQIPFTYLTNPNEFGYK
jgi:hypothetical protein